MPKIERDQKFKADGGKIQPSLLVEGMPNALEHVSAVLTYGAQKYEAHSWQGVDPERYRNALLRHELAAAKDELYDNESGLLHLAHLACNALFILELKLKELGSPNPQWNEAPQDHKKKER